MAPSRVDRDIGASRKAEYCLNYGDCMKPGLVQRKGPTGGWTMALVTPQWTAYRKGKFTALSSVVNVYDEHLPPHDEWLISFSVNGVERVTNSDIRKLLRDFEAEDFLEDNHKPGVARKFWMAVDPKYRVPCPCQNEVVVAEGDYRYSLSTT